MSRRVLITAGARAWVAETDTRAASDAVRLMSGQVIAVDGHMVNSDPKP